MTVILFFVLEVLLLSLLIIMRRSSDGNGWHIAVDGDEHERYPAFATLWLSRQLLRALRSKYRGWANGRLVHMKNGKIDREAAK